MREVLVLGILIAGLWGNEGQAAVPDRLQATEPTQTALASLKSSDCRGLAKELRSFQNAQSSLMRGFVQKNETLAETLDLYSTQFQKRKGMLKKGDYASLSQSADAFRSHGVRESNLVGRFETSANALIDQVVQCLESPGSSMSLIPGN